MAGAAPAPTSRATRSAAYTCASRSSVPFRAALRVRELTRAIIILTGIGIGDLSERAIVSGEKGRAAAMSATASGRTLRSCFENMPASSSGRPSIGDVPPKPMPPIQVQPICSAKKRMLRSSARRWMGSGKPE